MHPYSLNPEVWREVHTTDAPAARRASRKLGTVGGSLSGAWTEGTEHRTLAPSASPRSTSSCTMPRVLACSVPRKTQLLARASHK